MIVGTLRLFCYIQKTSELIYPDFKKDMKE